MPLQWRKVVIVQLPSHIQLCNPMACSTAGLSVPYHFPKFAQVHVHCISDAIQPSYPLMPSSSALNLSQHQELFQRISCLHQMTKYGSFSFSISPSTSIQSGFPLRLTGLISFLYKGLSEVISSNTVWRLQFFGALPFLWSRSPNRTWALGRP